MWSAHSKEKIHHVDEPCCTPAVNVIIAKPKVLTDIMHEHQGLHHNVTTAHTFQTCYICPRCTAALKALFALYIWICSETINWMSRYVECSISQTDLFSASFNLTQNSVV